MPYIKVGMLTGFELPVRRSQNSGDLLHSDEAFDCIATARANAPKTSKARFLFEAISSRSSCSGATGGSRRRSLPLQTDLSQHIDAKDYNMDQKELGI